MWEALIKMHENEQIDYIDVKNRKLRDRILSKYSDMSSSVRKLDYVPAM